MRRCKQKRRGFVTASQAYSPTHTYYTHPMQTRASSLLSDWQSPSGQQSSLSSRALCVAQAMLK
eukprot:6487087-Amphidinium_carterae.1